MTNDKPRKVFGIGLPKTGTTTLGAMLRQLGYAHAPYDTALIGAVAEGDMAALRRHLDRYDTFEDWPWPAVYKEADAACPDSAFVLTLRKDVGTWLRSSQKHEALAKARRQDDARPNDPATRLSLRYVGAYDALDHADRMAAFYEEHTAAVRRHFADRPEQLIELCWETGSGWPELCAFLGHPVVPGPVPHANSSQTRAREASWLRGKVRGLRRRLGI